MSVVYILIQSDYPITGKNKGDPIGVASTPELAEAFWRKEPEKRDYIPFNLDEIPEDTGIAPTPLPPPPQQPMNVNELEATRKRVEEATLQMRQMMEKLKSRRK